MSQSASTSPALSTSRCLRIAYTPGEPAGIGPDLIIALAQNAQDNEIVVIADPELLRQRARQLQLPLTLRALSLDAPAEPSQPGELVYLAEQLKVPCHAGQLNTANAGYVLETLKHAIDGCQRGDFDAYVTGPAHKGIINEAGIAFSGHTEFLAERTETPKVVMMLATEGLRVALATTHIPLSQVPAAITEAGLSEVLRILHHDLQQQFGIEQPNILVCGLNPHAGEHGLFGDEEARIITPAIDAARKKGFDVEGPIPPDTAFIPAKRRAMDFFVCMYHDQGHIPLKALAFDNAVNITLGLPIIRTSVDHGTALDIAGQGKAKPNSLFEAVKLALKFI